MKFFRNPFAVAGEQLAIPEAVQPDGSVSMTEGYGVNYQKNPVTDPTAKRIERTPWNWLFNQITGWLRELHIWGTPQFIPAADNGGVAYPYGISAQVMYDPGTGLRRYESLVSGNTALPTDATKWRAIDLTLFAPLASPAFTGTPTVPTFNAYFDVSFRIANTNFVWDVVGNYSGGRTILGNETTSFNNSGKLSLCAAGGPITVTLGPLASMKPGAAYHYISGQSGTVTVVASAGDSLVLGGSIIPSITLAPGESLTCIAHAGWQLSGTATLKLAQTFQAVKAVDGYQRLPSGVILQWGSSATNFQGAGSIVFPIAFPNACRSFHPTPVEFDGLPTGQRGVNLVQLPAFPTGADVQIYEPANGQGVYAAFTWFAIGY